MAGVAFQNVFTKFFPSKRPLSLLQLEKLGKLEVNYTDKVRMFPSKKRINNYPEYMLIEFNGVVVAEAFNNQLKEFPIPKNEWKKTDIVLLQKILDEIRVICK